MNIARTTCIPVSAILLFGLATTANAQQQPVAPSAQDQQAMRTMAAGPAHSGPGNAGMSAQMTTKHNQRLQTQVTTQSAQLLALAHKLNVDLDRSSANELSLAVVRDAAKIEKLAKSIQKNAHDIRKEK